MDDDAFFAAFEAAAISPDAWDHRSHVRLAWITLHRFGEAAALERVRAGLRAFLAAHQITDGPERGYHETLTVAWLRVVAVTMRHHPAEDSLAFCAAQPHLCQKTLLRLYYTRERLMSPAAKAAFVEPDLAPLPAPHRVFRSS